MNDDLISRQAAIDGLNKKRIETMEKGKDVNLIWECLDVVAQVPSAQSEIIRCKDCKYHAEFSSKCNKLNLTPTCAIKSYFCFE